MLLCIDIGNTNIVFGGFRGQTLDFEFRLKTDAGRTVDEYRALLAPLLQGGGQERRFERAVISSVAPPLTPLVSDLVSRDFGLTPLLIGPGIRTGLSINIQEPATVGADRVVNAVALKAFFGTPGLVIDFGTATSFDYVSKADAYEGGIIAPGLHGALEALVRNTAKLPRIELAWPRSVIGKSTVTAMQAGTLVGYVCLVDGLIERVMAETGPLKHIVATGGLGEIITRYSGHITAYDPHLTLKGMRLIAELNP